MSQDLEMIIGLEHEVATRAIAHANKVPFDHDGCYMTDGAAARDLMGYYVKFGIAHGPAEARQLIRKIRSDAIAADKGEGRSH